MAYVEVEGNQVEVKDHALDLSCMHIEIPENIDGLYRLTELQLLNLSHNKIGAGFLGPIGQFEQDGIFHGQLERMPLEFFKNMEWRSKLKYLDLSFNSIRQIRGIEYLPNLEFLDLSHNNIEKDDGLAELHQLPCLKTLCLENNPISIEWSSMWKYWDTKKGWRKVDDVWTNTHPLKIPDKILSNETLAKAVEAGEQAVSRQTITFAVGNYDEWVCFETDIRNGILDLNEFSLGDPFLSDECGIEVSLRDADSIDSKGSLRAVQNTVKKLLLSNSRTFGGFKGEFAGFQDVHPNLEFLDLSHNNLKQVKNGESPNLKIYLPNLKTLNLSHNQIQTIKDITLNLPKLEELNLSANPIISLEGIEKFPNLQTLNLHGNNYSRINDLKKFTHLII